MPRWLSSGQGTTMCAKVICDSSDSRRALLPRRAGKCISNTSFTNESKIAAKEVPVRNDDCVNLCNILQSDCSCRLHNYREVLFTRGIGHWFLMTVGYTWNYIFLLICTSKIAVQVLSNGGWNACKYGIKHWIVKYSYNKYWLIHFFLSWSCQNHYTS